MYRIDACPIGHVIPLLTNTPQHAKSHSACESETIIISYGGKCMYIVYGEGFNFDDLANLNSIIVR